MQPLANLSSGLPEAAVSTDLVSVGLVLAIVGCFLLANAILFRHPRALVREHFGKAPLHLRNIREYIFHRVQVTVGFTFLLGGFTAQFFGRFQNAPNGTAPPFPTFWVGLSVVLAGALLGLAWWWSLWAFRRYVRQHFLEHQTDLEVDGSLAREVGALFGVDSYSDDTVQTYTNRLRRTLGLPAQPRTVRVIRTEEPYEDADDSDDFDDDVVLELERSAR